MGGVQAPECSDFLKASLTVISPDLRHDAVLDEPSTFTPHPERLPWSGALRRAKLRVPILPADAVARPRLLQRIEDEGRPLTLIVAPAGYGKTTLAAQWATQGAPAAWLSIDHRDILLDRFWAHLRATLAETVTAAPALGEIVSATLAIPHRASALDLGRLLADELLDVPDARLIIDDLHLLKQGEVHEFLTGLLEIAPPGLRLLITSRVEPPLPLNRMRLRGKVTEIRGNDLLFNADEVESFVARGSTDVPSNPATRAAGALDSRTSGWAAGLRLVALSSSLVDTGRGIAERPEGSEQELLSWLLEETLGGRPEAERAVLLRAALPERFNPRLTLAMAEPSLPMGTVREALDFATRADLCRRSVRNDGDWLEFHPLFRDTLRLQLEREEEPQAVRELHLRAATWLEETGYIDEAIDHLLAAGDQAAAGALVEREMRPALNREDWPPVARWLAKLPADLIQQTPRLLLAQGMIARLRGQPISIVDIQIALEARLAQGELSDREIATLRGEFDCLRANSTTSDTIDKRGWLETAHRAIRRIDPSHRYELGVAWVHYGMALSAAGKHQQAIQRLEAWIEESGPEIDAGSIRGFLGLLFVHAQAGSLAQGAATARTTLALAEHHGLRLSSAWAHRFLGDALYEVNDLDGAIGHFGAVARDHSYLHLAGVREALFGLALSYLATGRRDEAERALRRSREIAIAAGVLHHLPAIEAQQAYLALLSGNRDEAALWASGHDPALSSESFHVLIHPAVIRATILCATADQRVVSSALASLDRVRRELDHWGYPGPMVRVDALRAVALLRRGDRDAAIAAMRAACTTARANGHVRSFLDLLPIFPSELENISAAVMLPTAAQQALRQATCPDSQRPQTEPTRGALNALTEREREVLACLAQRFSYREIGDQLYISPHTVKRHVTSIYSKLDVSGRLEAIRVARDLGWTA